MIDAKRTSHVVLFYHQFSICHLTKIYQFLLSLIKISLYKNVLQFLKRGRV